MTDPADVWLDDEDQAILDGLAALHARLDPPPADLDARVTFAIALDDVDVEVARLADDAFVGSGARGDTGTRGDASPRGDAGAGDPGAGGGTGGRGSERTRTITFDADSRTVMITITDRADGLVRLDGWLAPAAALRVELRLPEPAGTRIGTSDEAGRFVFDGVPRGLAQLLVHPPAGGTAPRVVTPSLAL